MSGWLIALLIYYILGWILYVTLLDTLDDINWEENACIATFFAVWIFWAVPLLLREIYDNLRACANKADIHTVQVSSTFFSAEKTGLVFYRTYDECRGYYNFPDEKYSLTLQCNFNELGPKEFDKAVKVLQSAGDAELTKIAKIRSYGMAGDNNGHTHYR